MSLRTARASAGGLPLLISTPSGRHASSALLWAKHGTLQALWCRLLLTFVEV